VPVIALTGGIAAGKSTVARRLADRGAVNVDADVLARDVVEPGTPALARIQDVFGSGVLATNGSLDRAALGRIIFSDPVKRETLNTIIHPAVRRLAAERIGQAQRDDPTAVVVYDVPLLVEGGPQARDGYDLVVVVDADAALRVDRLVRLRGMMPAQAAARVAAQADDAARRRMADIIIDANGSLEETLRQTDAAWEAILRRTARPSMLGDEEGGRKTDQRESCRRDQSAVPQSESEPRHGESFGAHE
jgi:dephospho-CoA kinase